MRFLGGQWALCCRFVRRPRVGEEAGQAEHAHPDAAAHD